MIEVIMHDGPGRLGRLAANGRLIQTPAACFFRGVEGGMRLFDIGPQQGAVTLAVSPSPLVQRGTAELPRLRAGHPVILARTYGHEADREEAQGAIFRLSDEGLEPEPSSTKPKIAVLETSPGEDPVRVVECVAELRNKLPFSCAIMLPDAEVWSFPLFALAGVDLFSDCHATVSSWSGRFLFESFSVPAGMLGPGECQCPYCGTRDKTRDLFGHNRWLTERVLSEIRASIRLRELKHLAEERSARHPRLASALKHLYRNRAEYMEEFTTVCPGVEP